MFIPFTHVQYSLHYFYPTTDQSNVVPCPAPLAYVFVVLENVLGAGNEEGAGKDRLPDVLGGIGTTQ